MRRTWGPWRLDAERLALDCYLDGSWTYEVDLERCTTSAEVLDWIAQVSGKGWFDAADPDAQVVGHLVMALDALLCPQATLCSFGMDRRMTRADIAGRVKSYLEGRP
jgi:hypothetical protein